MTQKYLTWNRYWVNEYCAKDPDLEISKLWPEITFTHTGYLGGTNDARHLAIGSYVSGSISSEAWTRFKNNFSHYCFYETTPGSAVSLCNEWYTPDVGSEFTLDGDGFTIVDNR